MTCMSYLFIYYKNHTRNFPGGDTFLLGDVGVDRLDAGNNLRKTLKMCIDSKGMSCINHRKIQ